MTSFVSAAFAALMVVLLSTMGAAAAETNRRGFYFGLDVGAAIPHDLESQRTNTGIPTNCDQWLDAADLDRDGVDDVPLPLEDPACLPSASPKSSLRFNLDTAVLVGASVGYALNGLRIEAEYLYRQHGGQRLALFIPGDPKQPQFVMRDEEVETLRGNHLFANLYYDFQDRLSPALTPYLGFGLGLMMMEIDYTGTSIRADGEILRGLGHNPNAGGVLSRAKGELSDTLFGYQLIAGLDYALNDRLSLGVKVRYGDAFGEFEDGGNPWEPLRNHASTVGPPGTPGADLPVHYEIRANNLGIWGLSLGFKYFWR